MGVPHPKLLITVCQSMPLEMIRSIGGVTIDCRGTLEGMFA